MVLDIRQDAEAGCKPSGFATPTAQGIFQTGGNLNITWYVGRAKAQEKLTFALYLKKYRNNTNQITILPNRTFAYAPDPGPSPVPWTGTSDACNNTAIQWNWTIPADLDLGSDHNFIITAWNTTNNQLSTQDSDIFRINSGNDTTDGNGGAMDNSAAVAIGVGVGVGVAVILALVFGVYCWRSRKAKEQGQQWGAGVPVKGLSADTTGTTDLSDPARSELGGGQGRPQEMVGTIPSLTPVGGAVSGPPGGQQSPQELPAGGQTPLHGGGVAPRPY